MTNIRTKWHRLEACVDVGSVYWTAAPGKNCPEWSVHAGFPLPKLKSFFNAMDELPKFVIDPELGSLYSEESFHLSILDMKRADVMRLPFQACIVELEYKGTHGFVLLRDLQADGILPFEDSSMVTLKQLSPFYAMVWLLQGDEHGDYMAMCPSVFQLDFEAGVTPEDGPLVAKISGFPSPLTNQDDATFELCNLTAKKDVKWAYHALFAALLLLKTKGVKHEVIECERLNRKRTASGKPAIPRHTYITIGKVYRSASGEAADDYAPRKSPRPHWRRGHLRHVRIGEGRTGSKPVFIEGRLVSLAKDAGMPAPTYHVKP